LNNMIILAIETSCDETGISFINAEQARNGWKVEVKANELLSQIKTHAQYGGVFPMLAKREHAKNLIPLLKNALAKANLIYKEIGANLNTREISRILEREPDLFKLFMEYIPTINSPKIDAITVTYGPGLEPALWVGINFAKALSSAWNIPIIPANHMEGHIISALLTQDEFSKSTFQVSKPAFPALALLISGGHTELILMEEWGRYRMIGRTRDDAVGEAFDKVARILGLPYPGGPEISRLADLWRENSRFSAYMKDNHELLKLPRPMINSDDFDFSFSGLKTAVLYKIKKIPAPSKEIVSAIAVEFENAATEVLVAKARKAIEHFNVRTLIISGGVSANNFIRKSFAELGVEMDVAVLIPPPALATDNAIMIALAGMAEGLGMSRHPDEIRAVGNEELGDQ